MIACIVLAVLCLGAAAGCAVAVVVLREQAEQQDERARD